MAGWPGEQNVSEVGCLLGKDKVQRLVRSLERNRALRKSSLPLGHDGRRDNGEEEPVVVAATAPQKRLSVLGCRRRCRPSRHSFSRSPARPHDETNGGEGRDVASVVDGGGEVVAKFRIPSAAAVVLCRGDQLRRPRPFAQEHQW